MTPLRIALPKGRLTDRTLDTFRAAGVLDDSALDVGRRLVVPLPSLSLHLGMPVEVLLLKNADVPVYVEHGVAELGVCGTDVLREAGADVLEPITLPFGACRMALAARRGTTVADLRERDGLRVATKYPRTARAWLKERGMYADLVELGGSVELGAVLRLADAIVDLVETGTTLRENNLEVIDVLGPTLVRVIANRSLTGARRDACASLIERLRRSLAATEDP